MPRGCSAAATRSSEGAAVTGGARPTMAPVLGGAAAVGVTADDPEAVDYFKVMYAKRSKKKHKSYLDGTAFFRPAHRLAMLFLRCIVLCFLPTLLVMFCWVLLVLLTGGLFHLLASDAPSLFC